MNRLYTSGSQSIRASATVLQYIIKVDFLRIASFDLFVGTVGSKGWPGRLGLQEMDWISCVRHFIYIILLVSQDNSLKWVL